MPWKQSSIMDQKIQFISDMLRQTLSITELSEIYGISRKTAHKWIDRYIKYGPDGLESRSRKPRTSPNKTPDYIVKAIVEARQRHPSWGAKKLLKILSDKHPDWPWPARSTLCDILSQNGLVPKQHKRRKIGHPGKPSADINAPNDTWAADFKGQFKTLDGIYCYPLTITDSYSRFLLCCQALRSTEGRNTKSTFTRIFKEFGLPLRIRTDNGVPFATHSLARLSRLSAWWIRLGIYPELIEPGKPQQNGKHERMHRTLKAETTRPPAATMRAQQRKFNLFVKEFNFDRPHEALDQETPASFYTPSSREFPSKLPPIEYPDHFEVRRVAANGGIRWNCQWVNVSTVCSGDYVGLEEIDNGVWSVYFSFLKIGRLYEKHMRIEDQFGKILR